MKDSTYNSNFLQILNKRGYINQLTHSNLDEVMQQKKISAYIGFDCTASSLHIGSLVQIMILRQLQICGHQPIILLGVGTDKNRGPFG